VKWARTVATHGFGRESPFFELTSKFETIDVVQQSSGKRIGSESSRTLEVDITTPSSPHTVSVLHFDAAF